MARSLACFEVLFTFKFPVVLLFMFSFFFSHLGFSFTCIRGQCLTFFHTLN